MFSWKTTSENINTTVTTILNEGKQHDFECNSKKKKKPKKKHKAQVKGTRCNSFLYMIMPDNFRIVELKTR